MASLESGLPRCPRSAQAADREDERGDGRSELVRCHGEEVIAQPHRSLRLVQESGVVDGQGGPPTDLARQLEVGRSEPPGDADDRLSAPSRVSRATSGTTMKLRVPSCLMSSAWCSSTAWARM